MKGIEISNKTPKLYTLKETSIYLKISTSDLKELANNNHIGFYCINGKVYFSADHISSFLIKNETKVY